MIIDTSALIELLRRKQLVHGSISVVTLIEVLRGVSAEKRSQVKRLLEECFEVLPIDNAVIEKYCELYTELRRRGELVPDADLLIAATALVRGEEVLTKDKHFLRLQDLGLRVRLL